MKCPYLSGPGDYRCVYTGENLPPEHAEQFCGENHKNCAYHMSAMKELRKGRVIKLPVPTTC